MIGLQSYRVSRWRVRRNVLLVFAAMAGWPDTAGAAPNAAENEVDFLKHVQPILRQHCYECHAGANEEGGLNLGVKAKALAGGDSGPAIAPGKSRDSRLIALVTGAKDGERMPPDGPPLSKQQIEILRAWIDEGAAWPDGADVLDPRRDQAARHWAFQPLALPPVPDITGDDWSRTPIDRFILAAQRAKGLRPADEASRSKLIRRLYIDVVGLPPSPEEVAQFAAAADGEAAYPALVDRLLASPRHGERWGRHWLDVARYADSSGQEGDQDRPHAYRYRDFVIRALNEDMPFDTFVQWQLAGDELAPQSEAAAVATGFLVAGPHTVLENTFLEEERLRNRYNELDDMLSTIGTGMLGLTIGCARCHDHKYDAISAREYYQMLAALHSGDRKDVKLAASQTEAFVFRDDGADPQPTWLFGRGDFRDRTQPVSLGFPDVLSRGRTADEYRAAAVPTDSPAQTTTYQRAALAGWMTDVNRGAGPLVARVIVNRLWQHHFDEGLVRTPSDFGVRGERPTHPELLEWLAHDLVQSGWRLKRLHRLILTSSVYRQSARHNEANAKVDPENRLWWRMPPRRMDAEVVRDAMLWAGRALNLAAYGPAFKPPIAAEAMVARNLKSPYPEKVQEGPEHLRRTVYLFHKRVIPYPLLQAFDRPDSLQSCSRRERTTVAPQALALLNDPFVRRRAENFGDRLLREASGDENRQVIRRAFELALARPPSESEEHASAEFLIAQYQRRKQRQPKASDENIRRDALTDFCQSLFGLNEFIYVD